jgi:putative DNA primase/helicase
LQEGICEDLPPIDAYLDSLLARFNQPAPSSNTFDFNTAGVQVDYYQKIIENGAPDGERSEKFQEVVWHLGSTGWTVEQITDELAKYPNGIGLKYASRLLAEVTRSFGKWQSHRRTGATGSRTVNATPWPQIQIKPGELPRIVNEAEDALLLLGREIYQRGGMVVRPVLNQSLKASADRETESWQVIAVTRPHLVEILCYAAQFLRYDKRAQKLTAVDAPEKVAEAYLNRQGRWKLPLLAGIVNTPFLRVDGSICETIGYDPESHLLFKPENQIFPPVPQFPSKTDAEVALKPLRKLIETFPFVTNADRAVALAGILTALDRRSMATAPLIAFSSPAAGTGKSLLVDLMSVLATGRLMPVLSQGKNEEEFEKRLGASLLASDSCIAIDNCEAPLSGAQLCQALTQGELNIRLLGYSRNIGTAMNASIFATGNNLVIAGDLTRRCLLATLDAEVERPELRHFNIDVIEEAYLHRGELVIAALTVLRAWQVARAAGDRIQVDPYGGFMDWSRRVREPLIWLGETDPCSTVATVRENDPHRDLLTAVIMQWKENLSLNTKYTVQDVIGRSVNVPSFYNALVGVAPVRAGGAISNVNLGRWLKRVQGKIVSGFSLLQVGAAHGYPQWTLVQR